MIPLKPGSFKFQLFYDLQKEVTAWINETESLFSLMQRN